MKTLVRIVRGHPVISAFALIKLVAHLVINASGGYDYFRDEFYYIACTERLDWGYVDHPPLSIILLWLSRLLFGDSISALRLLPALGGAGTVVVTGLLVRELGGGKRAQLLALLAVVIAPILLALSDFYSMNAFEPLFWIGAALVLLRIINGGSQRQWLTFGLLMGLGLQNKHSMVFFAVASVVGFLLTPERKLLISRWTLLGGIVAGVLFLPNLFWQIAHDWPTLEFAQNAQQWKNLPMSPLQFFTAQIMFQHPLTLPLWLGGLVSLLFHPRLRPYRSFGFAFLLLFALFVLQRGKPYYLSPFFPLLLAAGASTFERYLERRRWKWIAPAYATALAVGGLVTAPLVLPILPVEIYVRYAEPFGVATMRTERHAQTQLPQMFADRFGWREMVKTVADVVETLLPEERTKAIIYCQNYGEAGAMEFFGRSHNLPPVVSGHNNYWLWGVPRDSVRVVIIVGGNASDHQRYVTSVEQRAFHTHPYAMRYESDLPIYVGRGLKMPLANIWPITRHYN